MRKIVAVALIAALSASAVDARRHHGHRPRAHAQTVRIAPGVDIVDTMRQYLGTNPTGWAHNWCGEFLSRVLRATGHAIGSPLARAYAHYGRPADGPAPGVIGVMPHHVFVVTAVSGRRFRAISGNDGHIVRERERSPAQVIAWRWPT